MKKIFGLILLSCLSLVSLVQAQSRNVRDGYDDVGAWGRKVEIAERVQAPNPADEKITIHVGDETIELGGSPSEIQDRVKHLEKAVKVLFERQGFRSEKLETK